MNRTLPLRGTQKLVGLLEAARAWTRRMDRATAGPSLRWTKSTTVSLRCPLPESEDCSLLVKMHGPEDSDSDTVTSSNSVRTIVRKKWHHVHDSFPSSLKERHLSMEHADPCASGSPILPGPEMYKHTHWSPFPLILFPKSSFFSPAAQLLQQA